jgi:hypothetical protein
MARLNWSRRATKGWAYNQTLPSKPMSAIAKARRDIAICLTDLRRSRPQHRAIKQHRLDKAKAALLIAIRNSAQ